MLVHLGKRFPNSVPGSMDAVQHRAKSSSAAAPGAAYRRMARGCLAGCCCGERQSSRGAEVADKT